MSIITPNAPRPDLFGFTMPLTAVLAAIFGFVGGNMVDQPWIGALIGAAIGCAFAFVIENNLGRRTMVRWGMIAVLAVAGLVFGNVGTAVSGAIIGAVISWFGYWLATEKGMEAAGLWAGLAIGLTIMSVGLSCVFFFKFRLVKSSLIPRA